MAVAPWKLDLQPASFNGAEFHVEMQSRSSGLRVAMHEFPKKQIPYGESMGRRARAFAIVGYVIGPNYEDERDALIEQLEIDHEGQLILPTSFDQKTVLCDRYSVTERRERGGYAEIEMLFLEAGQDPSIGTITDTSATTNNAADSVSGSPSFNDIGDTFINSSDITALT
jgi:prophage DNA circulation protein